MRISPETNESVKIPVPDIERLLIDTLQLSQGVPQRVFIFAVWMRNRYPYWKAQYFAEELVERTKYSVINLVQGFMHRDVSDDFPTAIDIETALKDDASNFLDGLKKPKEALLQVTLYDLLHSILMGDFVALTSEESRAGHSDELKDLLMYFPFSGRPRRPVSQDLPSTPQRDMWDSKFVYFVLMTPEQRIPVHGQDYGLHPALEEMCSELRDYYRELWQKEKLTVKEQRLLDAADHLIDMWDEHHEFKVPR